MESQRELADTSALPEPCNRVNDRLPAVFKTLLQFAKNPSHLRAADTGHVPGGIRTNAAPAKGGNAATANPDDPPRCKGGGRLPETAARHVLPYRAASGAGVRVERRPRGR
jgi:hypothetical protein